MIPTFLYSAKQRLVQVSRLLAMLWLVCCLFEHLGPALTTRTAHAIDAVVYPPAGQFAVKASAPHIANIEKSLRVITQSPHPMGSPEQKRLARWMTELLGARGWKAEEQRFSVKTPTGNSKDKSLVTRVGRNVVASRAGVDDCAFIIGGHYDSKYFPEGVKFVGANDGGSSTALMLELARLWMHPAHALSPKQKSGGTWFDCDIVLAFFDGEEAFLPEWTDGERLFGQRDNLYGSREFVNRLPRSGQTLLWKKKPVRLFVNLDMIGHKKQNLFITEGSDNLLSEQFIALRGSVPIKKVPLAVEDDHIPFMRLGIPFIHVIDWTNLQEWHTPQDTLDIVSAERIAALIEVVMKFTERKRP
ncbi:MAG: hypothetical protein RL189_3196 [Pseudomonadota bacterium]